MAKRESGVAQYVLLGMEAELRTLKAAQVALEAQIRRFRGQPGGAPAAGRKRRLSAAGRKAISDAAKRRWAKQRKASRA